VAVPLWWSATLTPGGRAPISLIEAVGNPEEVTVNVPAFPTVKVELLALVIAGGCPGGGWAGFENLAEQRIGQRMIEPNTYPSATAMVMLINPGTMKGWLNTALPICVVPVSSICTAARSVGYVGRMNSADTAEKAATAANGATPIARASCHGDRPPERLMQQQS
jgi:hypothetical protein